MAYLEAIMANQVFEDVIAAITSLKVLYLDAILFRAEAEILAQNLVNLEEIYAYTDSIGNYRVQHSQILSNFN